MWYEGKGCREVRTNAILRKWIVSLTVIPLSPLSYLPMGRSSRWSTTSRSSRAMRRSLFLWSSINNTWEGKVRYGLYVAGVQVTLGQRYGKG